MTNVGPSFVLYALFLDPGLRAHIILIELVEPGNKNKDGDSLLPLDPHRSVLHCWRERQTSYDLLPSPIQCVLLSRFKDSSPKKPFTDFPTILGDRSAILLPKSTDLTSATKPAPLQQ